MVKSFLEGRDLAINTCPTKEAHDATQYLTEISQLKAEKEELKDVIKRLGSVEFVPTTETMRLRKEVQELKAKIKKYETYG